MEKWKSFTLAWTWSVCTIRFRCTSDLYIRTGCKHRLYLGYVLIDHEKIWFLVCFRIFHHHVQMFSKFQMDAQAMEVKELKAQLAAEKLNNFRSNVSGFLQHNWACTYMYMSGLIYFSIKIRQPVGRRGSRLHTGSVRIPAFQTGSVRDMTVDSGTNVLLKKPVSYMRVFPV